MVPAQVTADENAIYRAPLNSMAVLLENTASTAQEMGEEEVTCRAPPQSFAVFPENKASAAQDADDSRTSRVSPDRKAVLSANTVLFIQDAFE